MLAIRWTLGDVSPRGFKALRLSLWGAWRIFGASAAYRVLVNTVSVAQARQQTGPHPDAIEWQAADALLPAWLEPFLAGNVAHGYAWKLAPLRCFPDAHELSLDNDVILWAKPAALGRVSLDDVTICSPFPPHLPHLGRCGAHFVWLNARRLGFEFDGEPAELVRARHWDQHRERLYAQVGLEAPEDQRS